MKRFLSKFKLRSTKREKTEKPKKKFYKTKRFYVGLGLAAVILVGGIIGLTSVKKNTMYTLAINNLAEARHYMKWSESSTMRVQFFSGMREENYATDGKPTKLIPFAIVNVDPKDSSLKDMQQIDGQISLNQEQIPITLTRNPFDRNFAVDMARMVDESVAVNVTLFISSTEHPTFKLENPMGEDAISWNDALRVASKELGGKVKDAKAFEVYVKIINDMAADTGAFWYIQYVTDAGKTYYCVVAPDGSVIAQ